MIQKVTSQSGTMLPVVDAWYIYPIWRMNIDHKLKRVMLNITLSIIVIHQDKIIQTVYLCIKGLYILTNVKLCA